MIGKLQGENPHMYIKDECHHKDLAVLGREVQKLLLQKQCELVFLCCYACCVASCWFESMPANHMTFSVYTQML